MAYAVDKDKFRPCDVNNVCHAARRMEGCTTAAFDRAAMNNHVEVVRWLTENRDEGGTDKALRCSMSRGHTQVQGGVCLVRQFIESQLHAPSV